MRRDGSQAFKLLVLQKANLVCHDRLEARRLLSWVDRKRTCNPSLLSLSIIPMQTSSFVTLLAFG